VSNKLTFGYLYDFRNPAQWHRPWSNLYAETLDFIAWTESVGFGGAWVPEHHAADDGYVTSPLVVLAAIAMRTKSIKLGSGIALAPLYHPVRFAEECTALDILSNGRLEMSVAIGYRRREAEAYGVDFSSRGRRTDEFLQIVRRLWSGETFSFEGKHFSLKNANIVPTPPRGHIPPRARARRAVRRWLLREPGRVRSLLREAARLRQGPCERTRSIAGRVRSDRTRP
jgi:alkanesulfonate monooxygenase SsuD/methylene tetrahydromethanopterin reductase-like flavin-dependent oxidoreductase (luciferase family)